MMTGVVKKDVEGKKSANREGYGALAVRRRSIDEVEAC
jgi:hypothetical protein